MDPNTGKIYEIVDAVDPKSNKRHQQISAEDARALGYVIVTRDLRAKEKADMQIRLYSPCACGSGKKFKFCCKRSVE
jgi:hypothetical protein